MKPIGICCTPFKNPVGLPLKCEIAITIIYHTEEWYCMRIAKLEERSKSIILKGNIMGLCGEIRSFYQHIQWDSEGEKQFKNVHYLKINH